MASGALLKLLLALVAAAVCLLAPGNALDVSASASLDAWAQAMLGDGQKPTMLNATEQLAGIDRRLSQELQALAVERQGAEATCNRHMIAAQNKLKATKQRVLSATKRLESSEKRTVAEALLEANAVLFGAKKHGGLVDNNAPKVAAPKQRRAHEDAQAKLRREIAEDKAVLAQPANVPVTIRSLQALKRVYQTQTRLLMDTTRECALQTSLFRSLVDRLTNNQKTCKAMGALLSQKKGEVQGVLDLVARTHAALSPAERQAVRANRVLATAGSQADSVQARLQELANSIALTKAQPKSALHAATLQRVVATHAASLAHVRAQHASAMAKIKSAVAKAYMGPKAGTLTDVLEAARQGAVELIHTTHEEALAKIHIAHEASLNRINLRHVQAMKRAEKAAAAGTPADGTPTVDTAEHIAAVLKAHQAGVDKIAEQHKEKLEAIRAGRAAAHDEVVSKHAATMRAVMEKHANAIEELTAKEARRAEEGEANSGFPLLAPGPLTAPAGTAVLIPAYNLQSAAQSDFYRCKFQEQVVDAVFVHAKDRVTGKVGQYLKCTPPARETLENPVAVSVQASIDAGKTFFGQGVTFSYPGAHEVPQDDPSSFESVLVLRRAAEAWKKACDVAVAKSKNASTVVPVTPESEKVRALMASNARVACQRFSDATNDATNAAAAMHARVNAEKAAIIAQNASGYAKALNASAKDMLAKGRAMVANGTKLYNKALAAVNLLRSEIANATARAHAAEDHAAEYLKMNQAAHAERTKHQTALHTQILATTKLENIVDQLTIQLKKQKGMEQAHSAGVAHSTEVETIQMRLDVAAKNLAAARATKDQLQAAVTSANKTVIATLKERAYAMAEAHAAHAMGSNASVDIAVANKRKAIATDMLAKGRRLEQQATEILARMKEQEKIAFSAINDIHYNGKLSTKAAQTESIATGVGMRVHPEIIRDPADFKKALNLEQEEPGVIEPNGRRIGHFADHEGGQNEIGQFPTAEETEDDETGATGATGGETGATGATGGETGATGIAATGMYASSSTGASGMTGGVDLAAAMAIEARNKKSAQQERAEKPVPVSDELLGTSTKPRSKMPSAARIAASLTKGCDFHNSGVLWCESLGRCFEPHTEDSACLDGASTLPSKVPADAEAVMKSNAPALDGSTDPADMADGVQSIEKEGMKAEQAEAADKERLSSLEEDAKAAELAVKKTRREGGDVALAVKNAQDASEAVAKTEANILKAKTTVKQAKAALKTVLAAEEKRLVKEESQEVEAKKALQERIRSNAEKQTPGSTSDMEQQRDEVADIEATEKEEKQNMERTKAALSDIKARDGDAQEEEKSMEATKPLLEADQHATKSKEELSLAKKFPPRLRASVTVLINGYNEASFDDEQKFQARTIIAEIAGMDVQQVLLASVVDPVTAGLHETSVKMQESAPIDDALDAFLELVNNKTAMTLEFKLMTTSVADAGGLREKFERVQSRPDDLLAMFQASGLNATTAVELSFRLPKVAAIDGATGATGAMNTNPSATGGIKSEDEKVDTDAVRENRKHSTALLTAESSRLAAIIAKTEGQLRPLVEQLHAAEKAGDNNTVAKLSSKIRPLRATLVDARKQDASVQSQANPNLVVTDQVHAAVIAQDKFLKKQCAKNCADGIVDKDGKVDLEELARKTQILVANVAEVNYQRARKGLGPLPVPSKEPQVANKTKLPLVAATAKTTAELMTLAGIVASDSNVVKATKFKLACEGYVKTAKISLENATAREQLGGSDIAAAKNAVVTAMQELVAAKKEETQRQVALAEDCGGAATPEEFKRVKDKCEASYAESVKRVSKANETIYATRAHFVLALTSYQQKLKVVKVSKAVMAVAEAHYNLALRKESIAKDEVTLSESRKAVTNAEHAAQATARMVKTAGNSDSALSKSMAAAQHTLMTAQGALANATEALEDSHLAAKSASKKYKMAQAGEQSLRKTSEATLMSYLHQGRAERALSLVTDAETAKEQIAADALKDLDAAEEAQRQKEGKDVVTQESMPVAETGGTGSTGATGSMSATAIELKQHLLKQAIKTKMLAAEKDAPVTVETLDGHDIAASGAEAVDKTSVELKKQRLLKAAKAMKEADEAIAGPRADDDKSDEELAAMKEAELKTAEMVEAADKETNMTKATLVGSTGGSSATGPAPSLLAPAPSAPTSPSITGMQEPPTGPTGGVSMGSSATGGNAFSTGATGITGGAPTPGDLKGAVQGRKIADALVQKLETEAGQLKGVLAAAKLVYAQRAQDKREAKDDARAISLNAAVVSAEIRMKDAQAKYNTALDRLNVAKAYRTEANAQVSETKAVLVANGMSSVVKGLAPPVAGEGKIVEVPKIAVRNAGDAPETAALKSQLVKHLMDVPRKAAASADAEKKAVQASTSLQFAERELSAAEAEKSAQEKAAVQSELSAEDAAALKAAQDTWNVSSTKVTKLTKARDAALESAKKALEAYENAQEEAAMSRKRLESFLAARRMSFVNGEGPMPRQFMKAAELAAEQRGLEAAIKDGGKVNKANLGSYGRTALAVMHAMHVESKMLDGVGTKPIWYVSGERSFSANAKECGSDAHICSEEEVTKAISGGFNNCACGFTSTVPTKTNGAKYGAAAGFNVVVASNGAEGCGKKHGINYCNWKKQSGAYCCANIDKDGNLPKAVIPDGKVPVHHTDGRVTLENEPLVPTKGLNISDSIHEETQTESLDTILKNGDARTAPRKIVPKPEIKKGDNMTAINELRALAAKRKKDMLAAERKPLNDSKPSEELAQTGATGAATGSAETGAWRGATGPRKEPTKFIVPTGPTGAATGPQDEDPKEDDTKPIDPKLLGTGATGVF